MSAGEGAEDEVPREPLDELLAEADASRTRAERSVFGGGGEFKIIRFRAGAREYAVPIDVVERTERIPLITPVPRCPSFVRGVCSLRGGVVCIVDLAALLGETRGSGPAEQARSMLVITSPGPNGMRRVAVLSESLPDFERVAPGESMPVPPADVDVYAGALERGGELVGILEPARLFEAIERRLVHAG